MNSLLKAFKEFYNEINGATLTGAIDVIVVEQADGSFICSPFHVRFGKLGVLRSREKIVDIEVNGEPVNIHMKLGESGEAFFVQECEDNDLDELPANLATSPLPTDEFSQQYSDDNDLKIRRNSTALDTQTSLIDTEEDIFEEPVPEFRKGRRHSERLIEVSSSNRKNLEYTTEQIRQELAAREATVIASLDVLSEENTPPIENDVQPSKTATQDDENADPIAADETIESVQVSECRETKKVPVKKAEDETSANAKEVETKSKKKRRKKSMMKKKASAANAIANHVTNGPITNGTSSSNRKGSLSSSGGSASAGLCDQNENDTESNQPSSNATSASIDDLAKSELAVTANESLNDSNGMPDAMTTSRICDLHFFSDTEVATSPYGSRPSTPIQSDSEFEISQRDNLVKIEKNSENMSSSTASWKWGELPTTPAKTDVDNPLNKDAKQDRNSSMNSMLSFMKETLKMRKGSSEGVYLSDLVDTDGLDPEVVAMYFPQKNQSFATMGDADDRESGNGTSLPLSPNSMEGTASKRLEFDFEQDGKLYDKNVIALSLCGGLDRNGPTEEEFEANLVEYSEVCSNPAIFSSPLLVVRLCGKYYSWLAACPIVMTAIAYRKPLSTEAIEQLMNSSKTSSPTVEKKPTVDNNSRRGSVGGYSWWNWRRSADNAGQKSVSQLADTKALDATKPMVNESIDEETSMTLTDKVEEQNTSDINGADLDAADNRNEESINSELNEINKQSFLNEKYRKTLRLSSEQIDSLNLKPGMNELEFSVTTAYQGTSRCKCYVFRWKHTDKVIISDIDGTITKSDVLGHILPMVGKDWAQLGVAELFTKIEQNGYKLLYLSARAIGQSRATRDYLRSIQQGDVKLPDGPLLLNPTSLISAFHREVIERKPEQFKIACLSDIKALFPTNPFYAGYGNRINDVWAYRAVGIPIIRIFTINPKGELKHELNRTFQSSYRGMTHIVDQLFPPINDKEESVEFSNFNFWREPVLEIDGDHLLDTSNSAIATSDELPRVSHLPATPLAIAELSPIPENLNV